MPKVPAFLQGVRSFKLRSLLIQLNGACGVGAVKHRGRTVGLNFDCSVTNGTVDDLRWVAGQAGWTITSIGASAVCITAACTMYGTLTGRLERHVADDGSLTVTVDLQAAHPADSVL